MSTEPAVSAKRDPWISLDGAVNVRDLGGLPTEDGRITAHRRLLRSDNLQRLSQQDVRLLVDDFGVRQVVDLRTAAEVDLEGPTPLHAEPGVRFRELSLYLDAGRHTDALAEHTPGTPRRNPWDSGADARELQDRDRDEPKAVVHYLHYLRDGTVNLVEAVRAIGVPDDGATLVHCAAGKDRTGTVVALALSVAGVQRAEIVADYARSAEVIEKIIARLAETETYAGDVSDAAGRLVTEEGLDPDQWAEIANRQRPRAETMHRLLELLDERAGGPVQWLRDHGLTAEEHDAIRARLLD